MTKHDSLRIELDGGRSYFYHLAPLSTLPQLMDRANLRKGRCLLITDRAVGDLYAGQVTESLESSGWAPKVLEVPAGEASKSYAQLHHIYDEALEWGIDRKTPVLALGGGVVGDLAGYAAATLLRGLPLIQIPTSLIAQVDSSIGGKTGINHQVGKNLIGSFYQPRFVCADVASLQTLPEREWTSGLAEVVKHALIADAGLFDFLEANWPAVLNRKSDLLPEWLYRAARVKTVVVTEDEREAGLRAILNFGHTFGHAIEKTAGYGVFTHGEAVILGMRAALHLSGRLHPDIPFIRIDQLLESIPIQGNLDPRSLSALMTAMTADKKVEAGRLRLVLLNKLGSAYVTGDCTTEQVESAWQHLFNCLS